MQRHLVVEFPLERLIGTHRSPIDNHVFSKKNENETMLRWERFADVKKG